MSEARGAGFAITGIGITLWTFFPLVEAKLVWNEATDSSIRGLPFNIQSVWENSSIDGIGCVHHVWTLKKFIILHYKG